MENKLNLIVECCKRAKVNNLTGQIVKLDDSVDGFGGLTAGISEEDNNLIVFNIRDNDKSGSYYRFGNDVPTESIITELQYGDLSEYVKRVLDEYSIEDIKQIVTGSLSMRIKHTQRHILVSGIGDEYDMLKSFEKDLEIIFNNLAV